MLNVSSEEPGTGAGVLLRALEPVAGVEHMRRARKNGSMRDLARGPGRLAAALKIDRRHDGIDLTRPGRLWIGSDGTSVDSIGESVRIGLTKGADARLRYFVAGSDYLSGARRLNVLTPAAMIARSRDISSPFIVLDGALATELERRGADLAIRSGRRNACSSSPSMIRAVHLDYFKAGATSPPPRPIKRPSKRFAAAASACATAPPN
jgi:hypothetical protein